MDPAAVAAEPAAPLRAASADGRWLAVATGTQLALVDRSGGASRVLQGTDLAGRRRSQAEALFMLPQRRSLLVSWPALGEWWEVSLDPDAPPVYDGFVHDWRSGEGLAVPGFLAPRRIPLPGPWTRIAFVDPRVPWVAGWQDGRVAIVHLDVRRRIALLDLPGADLAAATLRADGHWAVPCTDGLAVVDTKRWVRLR